jgi:glycosyltransferase involved in cell wall biosynthesis
MRILLLTVYFPPEIGPPQARNYDIAKRLIEWGHDVTVLTAFPNHPNGIIARGYRGKLFKREMMDGIDVLRTWLYASPNRGLWRWAAKHLSFSVSSLLAAPLAGRFDVVVVGSASLFLGLTAHAVSRYQRIPWVLTVSDLWPMTAVAQGRLSSRALIRLTERLAAFVYSGADKVVGVARSMCDEVVRTGVPENKVVHIPNGTDTTLFCPDADGKAARNALGLEGKFVVMYAGNMGPAHGLGAILDAAKLLHDDQDVQFVFVGDGPVKQSLVEKAARDEIRNVSFLDRRPQSKMPPILNTSDVVVIPQSKDRFFRGVVPFKTADTMACGRPIIMASPLGEATELLRRSGGGVAVEPECPSELAAAVRQMKDRPELAAEMGRRGRAFAVQNLERSALVKRFEEVLMQVVKAAAGPATEGAE